MCLYDIRISKNICTYAAKELHKSWNLSHLKIRYCCGWQEIFCCFQSLNFCEFLLLSIQRMSTCRWCTPSGSDTTEFLKSYASERLSLEDREGSNDDLCYCLECVVEYHKAREKLPKLHKVIKGFGSCQLLSRKTWNWSKAWEEEASVVQCQCRGGILCKGCVLLVFGNRICCFLAVCFFYIELQRDDCKAREPSCFAYIQISGTKTVVGSCWLDIIAWTLFMLWWFDIWKKHLRGKLTGLFF